MENTFPLSLEMIELKSGDKYYLIIHLQQEYLLSDNEYSIPIDQIKFKTLRDKIGLKVKTDNSLTDNLEVK